MLTLACDAARKARRAVEDLQTRRSRWQRMIAWAYGSRQTVTSSEPAPLSVVSSVMAEKNRPEVECAACRRARSAATCPAGSQPFHEATTAAPHGALQEESPGR